MSLWHAWGRHRPGELPRRRVWHLAVFEVASVMAILVLVSAVHIGRGGVGEEARVGMALRGGEVPAWWVVVKGGAGEGSWGCTASWKEASRTVSVRAESPPREDGGDPGLASKPEREAGLLALTQAQIQQVGPHSLCPCCTLHLLSPCRVCVCVRVLVEGRPTAAAPPEWPVQRL